LDLFDREKFEKETKKLKNFLGSALFLRMPKISTLADEFS